MSTKTSAWQPHLENKARDVFCSLVWSNGCFLSFLQSYSIWFSFTQADYEVIMKQPRDGRKREIKNLTTETVSAIDTNMSMTQIFSRRLWFLITLYITLTLYSDIVIRNHIFFYHCWTFKVKKILVNNETCFSKYLLVESSRALPLPNKGMLWSERAKLNLYCIDHTESVSCQPACQPGPVLYVREHT